MRIQALRFLTNETDRSPVQCEIELRTPEDLERMKARGISVAYVVPSHQLANFRKFKDLIVDRKDKHRAKGLAKLLLGHKQIPIINGQYLNPGQLRRSVNTLLSNARKKGEEGVYIIGVGGNIFQKLLRQADKVILEKGGKNRLTKWTSYEKAILDRTALPKLILDMLDCADEPEDLKLRYLGDSIETKLVRQMIVRAAKTDNSVLILGDTGTGKEIVAREIHRYSDRKGPFVPVNCGGIPHTLIESELFGHIKGAYTDAKSTTTGMWRRADRGTLFLDEIGELPLSDQVKILRAIQSKKIRPLGSEEETKVNARVIAATNQDLYSMVRNGQFREDLFYRLREFQIRTPALRDHAEDIPSLAVFFWKEITDERDAHLSNEILDELQCAPWPGNVRELKTALTNLRALFGTRNLTVDHLKALFLLYGYTGGGGREQIRRTAGDLLKIQSFAHLARVEEIVRACEETLKPLMDHNEARNDDVISSLRESLCFRMNELAILCINPQLFSNEEIFSEVYQLKGKLTYLTSLLQNAPEKAIQYLKRNVTTEFKTLVNDIANKREFLLRTSS